MTGTPPPLFIFVQGHFLEMTHCTQNAQILQKYEKHNKKGTPEHYKFFRCVIHHSPEII